MNQTRDDLAAVTALRLREPEHPERRGIELAIEDLFVTDAAEALARLAFGGAHGGILMPRAGRAMEMVLQLGASGSCSPE